MTGFLNPQSSERRFLFRDINGLRFAKPTPWIFLIGLPSVYSKSVSSWRSNRAREVRRLRKNRRRTSTVAFVPYGGTVAQVSNLTSLDRGKKANAGRCAYVQPSTRSFQSNHFCLYMCPFLQKISPEVHLTGCVSYHACCTESWTLLNRIPH